MELMSQHPLKDDFLAVLFSSKKTGHILQDRLDLKLLLSHAG